MMHFKANKTRARIVHSALHIFSLYGKKGARMAEIVRHACVNKAAIYYHFRSKDNLYRIVFTGSLKQVVNKIYSEIQKSVTAQNQKTVGNILDRFRDDNPHILKLLVHELITGGQELKATMTRDDSAVRITMRKLSGIFAFLDQADWHNKQVDEKTLVHRAAAIATSSISRRLADRVLFSIYEGPKNG